MMTCMFKAVTELTSKPPFLEEDTSSRLRRLIPAILKDWEARARRSLSAARQANPLALRDMLPVYLEHVADALAHDFLIHDIGPGDGVAKEHGEQRAQLGTYSLADVLKEYQILRVSLFNALEAEAPLSGRDRDVIYMSIEHGIIEAGTEFARIQNSLDEVAKAEVQVATRRLENLQIVTEAALAKSSDIDRLLKDLVGLIQRIFKTDTVAIMLVVDEGKYLLLRAAYGLEEELEKNTKVPVGQSIAGKIISEKKPLIISEISQTKGVKSLIGAPLRIDDRTIGVIHTGSLAAREFRQEDAILLGLMADRIAIAIDHARLYGQVQGDVERLNEEQRLREVIISGITHDLRNPLSAILSGVQMIRRYPERVDAQERLVSRIEQCANRINLMIEDLLDVHRIRSGETMPLQMEHMDLVSALRNVIDELGLVHGQRFILEAPHEVSGYWNPRGITRIIENLASNGVKYGEENSPITVSVMGRENRVEIAVHNQGKEISPDTLATLYQPFHRSKSAESSSIKGWGIGLTLVKGLVEGHFGTIAVQSQAGAGTTFTIDLPRDARTTQGLIKVRGSISP
jgi:signal transduction histidine kinase